MIYRIEIWQYHSLTETYENDDVKDILEWYRVHWRYCYEIGGCSFSVYKYDEELSFEEEHDLGFYS